jgi:hypothetical protein
MREPMTPAEEAEAIKAERSRGRRAALEQARQAGVRLRPERLDALEDAYAAIEGLDDARGFWRRDLPKHLRLVLEVVRDQEPGGQSPGKEGGHQSGGTGKSPRPATVAANAELAWFVAERVVPMPGLLQARFATGLRRGPRPAGAKGSWDILAEEWNAGHPLTAKSGELLRKEYRRAVPDGDGPVARVLLGDIVEQFQRARADHTAGSAELLFTWAETLLDAPPPWKRRTATRAGLLWAYATVGMAHMVSRRLHRAEPGLPEDRVRAFLAAPLRPPEWYPGQ